MNKIQLELECTCIRNGAGNDWPARPLLIRNFDCHSYCFLQCRVGPDYSHHHLMNIGMVILLIWMKCVASFPKQALAYVVPTWRERSYQKVCHPQSYRFVTVLAVLLLKPMKH